MAGLAPDMLSPCPSHVPHLPRLYSHAHSHDAACPYTNTNFALNSSQNARMASGGTAWALLTFSFLKMAGPFNLAGKFSGLGTK